jgi:threonine dehydratase
MPTQAIDILKARKVIQNKINPTPLTYSEALSQISGAEVYLKWENLQKTGSYKPRGALYRASLLTADERNTGVITASAGNWALGIALACKLMGIEATICVPANTPRVKIERCRSLGADLVLYGRHYDEAYAHSQELTKETGKVYVSGTDDFNVIAGYGTLGLEILEDLPDVETIIAPVGSGGLLTGIATWAKTVNPAMRIIAAQSTATNTMHDCFKARGLLEVPIPPTMCEGLAGGITQLNLDNALRLFDDVVLCDEEQLREAILWVIKNERQVIEGSASVGPALILQQRLRFRPVEKVVIVISGGNIDLEVLAI